MVALAATCALTAGGWGLFPVLVAIGEWGDRYLADPGGPPIEFVHRDCDTPVEVHVRCTRGHEVAEPRAILGRPGPGVRPSFPA